MPTPPITPADDLVAAAPAATAAANVTLVPLSDLRVGATGTISTANLPCDDCELLRAMGMTEQCRFRVCRTGEPCIVVVNRTRLGLARKVTCSILVTPTVAATNPDTA